jgi:hypothetical protein
MNNILLAYVESALWSSTDDDDDPMGVACTFQDIAPNTLAAMQEDLDSFLSANSDDVSLFVEATGLSWEYVAHDFWLTRNRHGAGFWSRGAGDVGRRLTDAAHKYGESFLYAGDDGLLYSVSEPTVYV